MKFCNILIYFNSKFEFKKCLKKHKIKNCSTNFKNFVDSERDSKAKDWRCFCCEFGIV